MFRKKAALPAVALFCISFSIYLFFGRHPLWDMEAMYAEVPREMLSSGNFFFPTLNFAPFLYKPPLFFWANMASMAVFGQNLFAIRVPEAFFAAGTVVIIFLTGKRISLKAGIYSGIVMMTLYGFTFHTAMLLPDFPLAFFVAASILFFIKAMDSERGGVAGVYASLSLAVMTKGFLGVVFPGLAFVAYIALEKRWYLLRRFASLTGIAVFLAITVPWHIMMEIRNPGFLYNFIVNEQVLRFFNKRFPPDWDSVSTVEFIPITFGWLTPWSVFLFQACTPRRFREAKPVLKLAFLWGLSGVLFLALSSSKMEYYSLPVLPAFAVIIGSYWTGLTDRKALVWAGAGALVLAVVAAVGLAGIGQLGGIFRTDLGLSFKGAAWLSRVAVISFTTLLGGSFISYFFLRKGRAQAAFVALSAAAIVFSIASQGTLRYITPIYSSADAAKTIASMRNPGDVVVVDGVQEYEYSTTYCYYLRDRVDILLNGGNPVLSVNLGKEGNFLLGDGEFRRIWDSGGRVFFVTGRDPAVRAIAGLPDNSFKEVFDKAGRYIFINPM